MFALGLEPDLAAPLEALLRSFYAHCRRIFTSLERCWSHHRIVATVDKQYAAYHKAGFFLV
jgi:hypothetical protein